MLHSSGMGKANTVQRDRIIRVVEQWVPKASVIADSMKRERFRCDSEG